MTEQCTLLPLHCCSIALLLLDAPTLFTLLTTSHASRSQLLLPC